MKKILSAIARRVPVIAAACLIGGAAWAYPAASTTDLNMRAGPGTNHRVIGGIPAGGVVDVRTCHGNWCQVTYRGRVGWASARFLTTRVAHAPRHRVRPVAPVVPVVPVVPFAQPGVSIQLGFGTAPRFYDDYYYKPRYRHDRAWREHRGRDRHWREGRRHDRWHR